MGLAKLNRSPSEMDFKRNVRLLITEQGHVFPKSYTEDLLLSKQFL